MRVNWSLDISRLQNASYFDKKTYITSKGYEVKIRIDIHDLGDISELTWTPPAIALIDDVAKDLPDLKYLEEYTKVFYNDFMIATIDDDTVNLATIDIGTTDTLLSLPGTILSYFVRQPLKANGIRNEIDSNIEVSRNSDNLTIRFKAIPKKFDLIKTNEGEVAFTRNIAEFVYSNVILHILDTLDIVAADQEKEPTFTEKIYSREDILSKINDPFGHMPKIILGKIEKKPIKGNLEYTRKVRSKHKTTKSEDDYGNEERTTDTEE